MLIGHVSDERYVALAGVEIELAAGDRAPVVTRSTASGAIHADVEPGDYRITLAHPGFGAKHLQASLGGAPLSLRLLRDGLMGFVWPKWSRGGEDAQLKLHAVEPVRAELWRYGLERERIRLLGWYDEHGPRAMAQILPDTDFTRTGVQWNRTGFTSPGHIPWLRAPARSGLYVVHLETESGAFFTCPWVVAPKTPSAPVAVLASTNTWNAYNTFGGRSNYINAEGLPATPTVNARQDLRRYVEGNLATQSARNDDYPLLSFERPEPDCHIPASENVDGPMPGRVRSTLAAGLWRLLAWLEREGRAYDLYADHQLHTGELDLDRYRALVLDAHPEYWSRAMYERVKAWVHERGGRLIYLGGNGIDCEVEVHGDALRFLTQQPDPQVPGEEDLECRFHRTVESPAALLGVVFTHTGEGTAAPYRVVDPEHWALAGTGLAGGARFGAHTLHERVPGGASGHETDKLTPSSPRDVHVLARGENPDGGGAVMISRAVPGGGAVFSAGSITYIASLLVDPHTSRIAANVLDRFTEPGGDA
jgi:hypothetical protein